MFKTNRNASVLETQVSLFYSSTKSTYLFKHCNLTKMFQYQIWPYIKLSMLYYSIPSLLAVNKENMIVLGNENTFENSIQLQILPKFVEILVRVVVLDRYK